MSRKSVTSFVRSLQDSRGRSLMRGSTYKNGMTKEEMKKKAEQRVKFSHLESIKTKEDDMGWV